MTIHVRITGTGKSLLRTGRGTGLLGVVLLMVSVLMASCSENGSDGDLYRPRLTVVTSLNGAGDNGYNDKITAGVMQFYESHDVAMSLIRPTTINEARSALRSWLATDTDVPSLLVLAGSDYEAMMKSENITLGQNRKILLFESDGIPGICTFRIQRYGASYLAGCMASPHGEATVVAALPGEQTLADGIQGFSDGYSAHNGGRQSKVVYLADSYSGYAMPDSAYRLAATMEGHFIYPLAGGSNNGLYKYSREHNFVTMLVAGMDADCAAYSDRVPFSVVIKMDEVVERYLSNWYEGHNLVEHQTFGLESGVVDIVVSPLFYAGIGIWEDYYQDEKYWQNACEQYKAEAIKKETEYEAE